MWILLISPAETRSGKWEVLQFENEGALIDYKNSRDVTKECYWMPVDVVVEFARDGFD